ncbi:acyltransferase [Spirulina subsalsa]|uniref:acyltransferase n=1 Tax=Spirulina subsalsa TaxID=54311 RepID=UPI0002E08972|nr:hypothetical protein [Spirulina subsalsa]
MKKQERIESDRYTTVEYQQFTASPQIRQTMKLAGMLCLPFIWPLAIASRSSDFIFRTISELLSLLPYLFGTIIRYQFYRHTLTHCGENVVISFGTIFLYRDITLGDHVLIGMYNTIHYCDFGSFVLTADGCRFLSGAKYHNFERTDCPMALQGGQLRRVVISDDCWIGANAIILNDLGTGSIVGAGAVVTKPVEPYTIVAGNPATVIRRRL